MKGWLLLVLAHASNHAHAQWRGGSDEHDDGWLCCHLRVGGLNRHSPSPAAAHPPTSPSVVRSPAERREFDAMPLGVRNIDKRFKLSWCNGFQLSACCSCNDTHQQIIMMMRCLALTTILIGALADVSTAQCVQFWWVLRAPIARSCTQKCPNDPTQNELHVSPLDNLQMCTHFDALPSCILHVATLS
jgi:hypothetical protein